MAALCALACGFVGAGTVSAHGGVRAAKNRVLGVEDCVNPKVKPKRIILACGDAGIYANSFFWRTWGRRTARAGAVLHVKSCKPTCADGHFVDYAATVILHKVKRRTCAGETARFYTRVRLRFPLGPPPPHPGRLPTKLDCV